MKTEIYNLIILDESGSMDCVRQQTISGCNETINTIKQAQKKFADTQDHYVSIFLFQENDERPSHYIVKNIPADAAKHITKKDYEPWGGTPLYDAVGSTLVDLKMTTGASRLAIGSVTIITDGWENASRHYTLPKVAKMIAELKEMGWSFNFIGANIDVQATAQSLNIDNHMEFKQDEEGTKVMFQEQNACRMAYYARAEEAMSAPCSAGDGTEEEIRQRLRDADAGYFRKKK
ncbi:MAG: VWA domain-containing protein [Bacteroidales bacterium]|nr:VWA domain-containing protein [Bacteroidales bacterium]